MSDGSVYHKDSLTCAHRRYPLGTFLKVTNPANGKSVVVKVTDRGPFGHGRIIDLSYGAAKEIGMIASGVATVEVQVVRGPANIPYRDNSKIELPELDYEMNDNGEAFSPDWKKNDVKEQKLPLREAGKSITPTPKADVAVPAGKTQTETKGKTGNMFTETIEKIRQWKDEKFK